MLSHIFTSLHLPSLSCGLRIMNQKRAPLYKVCYFMYSKMRFQITVYPVEHMHEE